MKRLTKATIPDYLKAHMPDLDISKPLVISEIGEGTLEEDGDGYINFVFRVSDGHYHLIVKQGLAEGRVVDFPLSKERNRIEYDTLRIRKVIAPEYVPDIYFYDDENLVFVMEDVSYLKIARFQLNRSQMFPVFPKQIAEYMARTHFYMSEYYLDTPTFRDLTIHFMNTQMRSIFETFAFIMATKEQPVGGALNEMVMDEVTGILQEPAIVNARYELREKYMKQCETFLHGDLHTSNIFVGVNQTKVIDMEYTFCGPMTYDLGYLTANFVSQYICAGFRSFASEKERQEFRSYCLASLQITFDEYFDILTECWHHDAKGIFKAEPGFLEYKKAGWFADAIAFLANANLSRVTGDIGFPEYEAIEDLTAQKHARLISALICRELLLHSKSYKNINRVIDDIIRVETEYKKYL